MWSFLLSMLLQPGCFALPIEPCVFCCDSFNPQNIRFARKPEAVASLATIIKHDSLQAGLTGPSDCQEALSAAFTFPTFYLQ